MSRAQRMLPHFRPRILRRARGTPVASPESRDAAPPHRLRSPEGLEDRTLPAVTFFPDGSGKSIVRFTEDIPGTSDTLQLQVASGGLLAHNFNNAGFTTDLDSATPGVQSLAMSAISRIDVFLDGGNDVLAVDGLTNPDVIPSGGGIVFAAGTGTDRLEVSHDQNMTLTGSALTVGGRTIAFTDLEAARLTGGNSSSVIDASAFTGPVTLDGGNSDDTLIGGSGDDELDGVNGSDRLEGRGGNDRLLSSNSGTTMFGGDGADSLFGGNSKDNMFGEGGNDLLIGGNGSDFMDGGDGNDTFLPGNGNDTVIGGTGTDLVVGSDNVSWTLTDTSLTGEGTDTLQSIEQAQLTGGGGNNVLNATGFSGRVSLQGGGGIDALFGGTGYNVFIRPVGEIGNVSMTGGPAGSTNDYILWLQGALTLTSTGGYDRLIFLSAVNLDLSQTAGTIQVVDPTGDTVALTGIFEECVGSDFADSITAASNTIINGGGGKDKIVVDGKSNVVVHGGADVDTLQQTGSTNVVLAGDAGLDTLISTGGTGVVISGGADADTLIQQGGTSITMSGDDGLDILQSIGGSNISMTGGADTDTLQQQDGTQITMSGDEGLDFLTSLNGSQVSMTGGADADTLIQQGGTSITMSGDDGLDVLQSVGGTNVMMSGGADADTLIQQGGTSITMSGDSGIDSLTSQNGTMVVMSGGADADSLLQTGGSEVVMNGDDGLDTLTSQLGIDISMSGGAGADALIEDAGQKVKMSGGADADSLVSTSGTQITMAGDAGDDRLTVKEGVDSTVSGGAGSDTIVLAGSSLGAVVIDELAEPTPDLSRDTLDFSGFTGGPINLDLAVTTPQVVTPGHLTLTLTDAAGIENVIGTAFADTVFGNARDNELDGADQLNPAAGPAPAWNGVTQVVFLDFDTYTGPGEHVYTPAERNQIQARLVADYVGPDPANPWFHFQFTQTQPSAYPYARLNFNQTPLNSEDTGQLTGGFAYELDFRNLNLGTADNPSFASIQVNGILGAEKQPPDTSDNWVALSSKIAAHELGHLVGLLHPDSYGPIGYGPHTPPGGVRYNPDYTGPAGAFETFDHLMSSPAFAGSNRFNDLRDLYFGEREAVKLEFAESGTVIPEAAAPHRSFDTAQALVLAPLAVPNTLGAGALNAPKAFTVAALDVVGAISLDSGTGASEGDFYSLTGRKGDLFNIEVLSRNLTRLTHTINPNEVVPITDPNVIDPIVRVYDAAHNLVAYFTAPAADDDSPESTDASIVDLTLPADGTYFIEVDTFAPTSGPDTDVGSYELFAYQFDAGNANDVGDLLDGKGGNDTVVGGLGNDVLLPGVGNDVLRGGVGDDRYANLANGAVNVIESAGRDTLDFSGNPRGVTVNLALDAGQTQTLTSTGDTLAITGTVENVLGTDFADRLIGNAADNTLDGKGGDDTISGGLGNDVILGGDGNDTLDGDDGRDLLIGGLGLDTLRGLGGDDILIGGRTTYDANSAALDQVMAEWTGSGTYAQRVAHLTGQAGGLNGTTFLIKGTTVLDDDKVKDSMTGGLGLDLFFSFVGDKVNDREAPAEFSL